MYHSINTSQQVLTKLCTAINQLQLQVNEVKDEMARMQPAGAAPRASPATAASAEIMRSEILSEVRSAVSSVTQDVDAVKRDIAVLKLSSSSSSSAASGGLQNNMQTAEVEALVRKETDANSKKQRDLLEALLTAKYDRMIARSIQDASDAQRRELMCKVDSSNQDLAAAMEARMQQVMQLTGQLQQMLHMQQQEIASTKQALLHLQSHVQAQSQQAATMTTNTMNTMNTNTNMTSIPEAAAAELAEFDGSELVIHEKLDAAGQPVVELQVAKKQGRGRPLGSKKTKAP